MMRDRLTEKIPLLLPAVSLMAGIIIGDNIEPAIPLLPIFICGVASALLLWKYENLQSVVISLCLVVLGWLLMDRQKSQLRTDWPDQEICYEAVVVSEPVKKPKTVAVDIILTGNGRKLKCYLYDDPRNMSLKIGDGLRIQSVVRPNSDWHRGTFNYRRYLEVHGFSGSTFVSGAKWVKARVSLGRLSMIKRTEIFFLKLRSSLLERLSTPDGDSSAYAVIAAMTLGDKSALSQDVRDVYSVTGASHVLALSGLHLGIIYTLLSVFVSRRRWKVVSQALIVLAVWAFVFLVGMSASVVRSAVMISVYALLSLGRRDKMSVNVLAFTALVMLVASPMSLFDVGFQISFATVLAILLSLPLFERLVSGRYLMEHAILKWVWGMVAVSLAAQLGAAPLVAYYFGRVSTFFLLTNFIVVPAATIILYLAPVVLLLPSLANILFYVVKCLNEVLPAIAALHCASISGLYPSVIQVVMCYVLIGALLVLFHFFITFAPKSPE